MRIGESKIAGAEAWQAPQVESEESTIPTAGELLQNIEGGWEADMALQGVTVESVGKLLRDVYQLFDAEYEKRNTEDNTAKLDNLEKLIGLLQEKKKEGAVGAEKALSSKNPKIESHNVIDMKEEFTKRTEVNSDLTIIRELAAEMWGTENAFRQGDKIRDLVGKGLEKVRRSIQNVQPGESLRRDIVETLMVLRSGIQNQRAENKRPNVDLDQALNDVDALINEIRPAVNTNIEPKRESLSA